MITLLIFFIRVYQRVISPALKLLCGAGCGCRFEPSCSEYLAQALAFHGLFNGLKLGVCRITRCHPWGGCGYDPVPSSLKSSQSHGS